MRKGFSDKSSSSPFKSASKTALVAQLPASNTSTAATNLRLRLLGAQQKLYLASLYKKKARVLSGKVQRSTAGVVQRLLGVRGLSNSSKRRTALWQARSVRAMQHMERSLSA